MSIRSAIGATDSDRQEMDVAAFKETLAHFPSGVTIVTTTDESGRPHGFTANAFCSVSVDPPLVCVCVARSARCHQVFAAQGQFAINFLRPHHADLALRFARKSDDKFAHGPFLHTARRTVVLADALAVLECTVHSRHEAGDHTILVGRVRATDLSTGAPLVFYRRAFHRVGSLEC